MGLRKRVLRRGSVTLLLSVVAAAAIACTAWLLVRRTLDVPAGGLETKSGPASSSAGFKASISYEEASPILKALAGTLPIELQGRTAVELASVWPAWVSHHDADIRARLARGDEDSIVNLAFFGTTFTSRPRATGPNLAALRGAAEGVDRVVQLLQGRLEDLVAALALPGADERLQFARQVIERHGIDPGTLAGRHEAVLYLAKALTRVVDENSRRLSTVQAAKRLDDPGATWAAYGAFYRERGLASDTHILADFAVDRALETLESQRLLAMGSVRRIAVVGPGLDFTDKAEGYDFYPPQTIQPFAVIDSLIRFGLASAEDLDVTTFDVSPRVNQHIEAARQRARNGGAYVLQLPLDMDDPSHQWHPDLIAFWRRVGGAIGSEVAAIPAPAGAAGVTVRAVRVPPSVVLSIAPRDLNIVLERLEPLAERDRFDLVLATNILVYYDAFDQALALANISTMLRPSGFFLTNARISPAAPMKASASLVTQVYWDRQQNGDTLFCYQREK